MNIVISILPLTKMLTFYVVSAHAKQPRTPDIHNSDTALVGGGARSGLIEK